MDLVSRRFVTGIRPDGEVPIPAHLDGAVAALGPGPVAWAVALAARSTARQGVIGRSSAQLLPAVERATEGNVTDLLRILAGEDRPFALRREQVELVEAAVRNEIPFPEIVRGFRRIQRSWWEALSALVEVHEPAGERPALRARLLAVVPSYIDDNIDAVVLEYLRQRERLLAEQADDLRTLVTTLLGRPSEAARQAAAERLGLRPQDHVLAVAAWHADGDHPGSGYLVERSVRDFAARVRADPLVTLPVDADGVCWAWLRRARSFPTDLRASVAPPARVRLALGVPAVGAAGFRRSHAAAADAREVALLPAATGAVTVYSDVALIALLSAAPERAAWFVAERLGPLLGPAGRELRRTVLAHLEEGSLVATAQALHVHRNTVVHRLARAEQLLGRRLDRDRAELHAALLLERMLAVP